MPLIGSVIKQLAKSVLIPLGLTAAVSATVAAIYKKNVLIGHNDFNNFWWRNEWCHGNN